MILALIVYLLRNSILRSREFGADARVAELDPDTSLGQVLAGLPPRRGRRIWHVGWMHPSGRDRAAALVDPAPLYRSGFWDGLAIGLVAAMGAEAGQDLAERFLTPSPRHGPDTGVHLRAVFRGRPDRGHVADAAPARRDGDREETGPSGWGLVSVWPLARSSP